MLREILDVLSLLESPQVTGQRVATLISSANTALTPTVTAIEGQRGHTDFVRLAIPGRNGRLDGGDAPTLGIIGRHGGIGARPGKIGFVSDGDGAAAALGAALKLARMHALGDILAGDVLISTHVCPNAPIVPHEPVEFMGSPVAMEIMNQHEVDPVMDAIVSIDTTKGNRLVNHRGIAISPTVKKGWILRVSDDLVAIVERVTGQPAVILPLSMADITPYGNDVYHLNSILQPATATDAPVVGLAITTATSVAGSATGASHESDIASAASFAVEVAKDFTGEKIQLHDQSEFQRLETLYGSMTRLQTLGEGLA